MPPATSSLSSPWPVKRSTRSAPRMAPPVSWLRTKRPNLSQPVIRCRASKTGFSHSIQARAPSGNRRGSLATLRQGVSRAPKVPVALCSLILKKM